MIYVLYGALGVLLVLGLFGLGFFMGWKGRMFWQKHTAKAVATELSEQERRELRAEQEAFRQVLNYNVDTAYGLAPSLDELAKEE